jgi:rare lipoprotein A
MNHKLLKTITTIFALGTSVIVDSHQSQAAHLYSELQQNRTDRPQQSQVNAPQLLSDTSQIQKPNLVQPVTHLAKEINRNQEQFAKIYSHTIEGSNAATLFIRNIPVLTFLEATITSNTSRNTELVESKKAKSSSKMNSEKDPVSRAELVASQLSSFFQNKSNAQDIKVSWNTTTKGYSINVKDREIVSIDELTILPDTTKDPAEDALQATNRLRRLIGNAAPLKDIIDKPRKIPTRLERSPQDRVVRQIVGQASWYGPGFHGRTTANGERYNQEALTAAHPSLPFGTRIRVVNKNNGRSVIVRVNDRGPYAGGRILDLSAGAAKILGMMSSGIAPIQLQILGR